MAGRLIIGYDETSQGDDALVLGRLLSQALALDPVVVTVLPLVQLTVKVDGEARDEVAARIRPAIEERFDGIPYELELVEAASPARGLYESAAEHDARIIVVGSTHRGRVGRVLTGSVGDNLLNGAPCAIAIAPLGYAAAGEHRLLRIGVGFDGSEEAQAALRSAVELAERFHATLTVTTVAEPLPIGYGATVSMLSAGEFERYEVDYKRKVLDEALESIPSNLPVTGRLRHGPPARELIDASEDLDLLVMGSRGYGPLRRTLLGSTAAAVIDAARCAMLVLPRRAGDDPLSLVGTSDSGAE